MKRSNKLKLAILICLVPVLISMTHAESHGQTPYNPQTPVLDDFNRADHSPLSAGNWLDFGLGGFTVFNHQAMPVDAAINVNAWDQSFAADQEVYFTVTGKPAINNFSSLGALLRFNPNNYNGYLVTLVPQSGVDTIRIWRLTGGYVTQLGGDIYQAWETGDRILVKAVGNVISVYFDQGAGLELLASRNDTAHVHGGHIGIYAVTAGGALEDFGGGSITVPVQPQTPVLDDFDRIDHTPPASGTWLDFGLGGFTVFNDQAMPVDAAINVNAWDQSFAVDQEVYFTVTGKPVINNASSLGALLRFNTATYNGYLVTLVPQAGVDTIRVWRLTAGYGRQIGGDIYQAWETGDRIWVKATGNTIRVYFDQGDGFELIGIRSDSAHVQGGHIGIYGVTAGGALDDFGGGSIE